MGNPGNLPCRTSIATVNASAFAAAKSTTWRIVAAWKKGEGQETFSTLGYCFHELPVSSAANLPFQKYSPLYGSKGGSEEVAFCL